MAKKIHLFAERILNHRKIAARDMFHGSAATFIEPQEKFKSRKLF